MGSNWTSPPLWMMMLLKGVVNWNSGGLHGNSLACAAIPIISRTFEGEDALLNQMTMTCQFFDIPLTIHRV